MPLLIMVRALFLKSLEYGIGIVFANYKLFIIGCKVNVKCYSVKEIRENIGKYIDFYNQERPHQSLGYKTPDEVYFGKKKNVNFIDNFFNKKLPTKLTSQQ